MPHKDPEKYKTYQREYHAKKWAELTREEMDEINKSKRKYYSENKEVINEKKRKNRIKYHKQDTLYNWKRRGIIETWYYTYGELYDYYMKTTHCENCNIQLTIDKIRKSTTKCLHHIHETGEFEMIVCHACNIRLK